MKEIFLTSSPCIPGIEEARLNPANGFVSRIRKALPHRPKVLTVASSPADHAAAVYHAGQIEHAFTAAQIPFGAHCVLDYENAEDAAWLISQADFIILSGGHVPTQNRFFAEIGLRELLMEFDGVLMGISAGSMNSADTVYAHPEEEGEAIDPDYERWLPGLGLTELQILPHYNMVKDVVLDGLRVFEDIAYPDSRGNCFLVLPDGSYAHLKDGQTNIYGQAWWLHDCEMTEK